MGNVAILSQDVKFIIVYQHYNVIKLFTTNGCAFLMAAQTCFISRVHMILICYLVIWMLAVCVDKTSCPVY